MIAKLRQEAAEEATQQEASDGFGKIRGAFLNEASNGVARSAAGLRT